MNIVISAVGLPFNGDTIKTKSLGGSESAAYYQARELARRGHRVSVFTTSKDEGIFEDVRYVWCGQMSEQAPLGEVFEYYCRHTPCDVLIIQRHPLAFHRRYQAKVTIFQHHDVGLFRYAPAIGAGLWQCDVVTGVSNWHCDQLKEVYGINPRNLRAVPNGVDQDLYLRELTAEDETKRMDWLKMVHAKIVKTGGTPWAEPLVCLYQSRPERGLEHLVREGGIMDRLKDRPVHLIVCGYDNTVPQMKGYYEYLWGRIEALPNVTNLGSLTKADLALLQRSVNLLLYPTEFEEVSCITAMEAMSANLPMLSSACGALPETCAGSGTVLLPLKEGKADEDAFVNWISGMLDPGNLDASKQWADLRDQQAKAAPTKTWAVATDRLLDVIDQAFVAARSSHGAVVKHCIAHSDIAFLEWYGLNHGTAQLEACGPIERSAYNQLNTHYAFARNRERFMSHYQEHQGKYYDEFEDKVVGEDVTPTSRFRSVALAVDGIINEMLPKTQERWVQEDPEVIAEGQEPHPVWVKKEVPRKYRFLDYGCAHGHYLMPLAKKYPDIEFHGLDISARAIAAALKWAVKDNLHNVTLTIGGQEELDVRNELLFPVSTAYVEVEQSAVVGESEIKTASITGVNNIDQFDMILAGEVLEHVWDYHELLERFRNCLRDDGWLVGTTPVGRWEWTGTEAFRSAREHLHHFDRADLEEIFKGHQLELVYAPASHDRTGSGLGSWVWGVRFTPGVPIGRVDYERKLRELAPRQSISACLIVKDGERTLRKCIDSFIDWVDEVVVGIDPATRDRTRQVLEALQSDYPLVPFNIIELDKPVLESGFAAARNKTVDQSDGDWVLWLDADEEVQQPWNLWTAARNSPLDALSLPQVHYSINPAMVLTTDYPCRFFRKSSRARFHGVVHEHPEVEQGKAIPFTARRTDTLFLHSGYVDEETRRKRYARNLPLLDRDIVENPNREINKFLYLRDVAQGIVFEQERNGGRVTAEQVRRAEQGVAMFDELLKGSNLRMLIDALEYYSACVAVAGGKVFEGEVAVRTMNHTAPDLSVSTTAKGLFACVDHYKQLINRLAQEATAQYENRYL